MDQQPSQQPQSSQPPQPPVAAPPAQPAYPGFAQGPGAWAPPLEEPGPAPGVRFASHGARLVAYIVDVLLMTAIIIAISIALAIVVGLSAPRHSRGLAVLGGLAWFVVIFGVSLAYFPYFWARTGSTPGMRMFRLRVVRDADGGPITAGQAVLRLVGYWIDGIVFYLGYIWILVDKRRRGWHDLIAGTVVIETP